MISNVRLKNFKGFSEVEIPLRKLNLFAGLNGSGKSSVLQALGLLRQSLDERFLEENHLMLNGDLVGLGTGRDLLYQSFDEQEVQIELDVNSNGIEAELFWRIQVDLDSDVLTCDADHTSPDLRTLDIFSSGFQFLRADRITPAATYPKSQHSVRQRRFLGARGEFTAHYLREFGENLTVPERMRHTSEPKAASLSAQVNAWMEEFSPGVRVQAEPVPMTDFVRLVFSFRGEGTAYGDVLRPTNVGFGLTHALPVVVACLAAETNSVLIVENPEAQLHPRGQLVIGRLLALSVENGAQVIVETHSDHVLNGIRLAVKEGLVSAESCCMHFFSRHPGKASDFESPVLGPDGRLSYWPLGFFDQWEQSLDQLLD